MTRFERATFPPQTERSTKLSYTPVLIALLILTPEFAAKLRKVRKTLWVLQNALEEWDDEREGEGEGEER